jgi:hypothetical protein
MAASGAENEMDACYRPAGQLARHRTQQGSNTLEVAQICRIGLP